MDFGISANEYIQKDKDIQSRDSNSYAVIKGLAYFVADVTECSAEEWGWIFGRLKGLNLSRIIIKQRGPNTPQHSVLDGIRKTFPGMRVEVQTDGYAEETIRELKPEFVIGVESTVLFNVGVLQSKIKVISLARSVAQVSNAGSSRAKADSYNTSYPLRALEAYVGDRLTIL